MKKFVFAFFLLIFADLSIAQKFEDYEDIKLKTKEDYLATEDSVIKCCDYILACKLEDPGKSRMNAVSFMIRWATKAPYDFIVDEWAMSLIKVHDEFLVLQLAALVKFQLENKEASAEEIQTGAATLVYNYIKDPQFRVQQKGYLKKFVAAGDAGTLGEFIKKKK